MLPELAVAYAAGVVPAAAVLALHSYTVSKRFHSKEARTLQRNLARVGLYWSEYASEARPLLPLQPSQESAVEAEHGRYKRDILIFGIMGVFLSWLGFFFHLLIFVSLRFIAVPRLERAIFSSRLAYEDLKTEDVETEIKILRENYRTGI